jgi:hypothetical protein
MENLKTSVTETLQTKYPDKPSNEIDEAVSRSEDFFLNKIKRRTVPLSAFWLWVDLSAAMITGSLSFANSNQVVSSIKRGDTTISYNTSNSNVTNLLSQVNSYKVVVAK